MSAYFTELPGLECILLSNYLRFQYIIGCNSKSNERILQVKKILKLAVGLILLTSFSAFGQENDSVKVTDAKAYYAGFKTITLCDSSRIYKPNSTEADSLHYRRLDLDIWYPSSVQGDGPLLFGDLFALFEQRANQYQDSTDYTGLIDELAAFYAIELGLDSSQGKKLLRLETSSYASVPPSSEKFPIILYMAGLNGMGFENFKILEELAKQGFVVVSISSVGRYPGDMSNHKLDMLEQVYDAEFAMAYLNSQRDLFATIDFDKKGILACSWGGMSASTFINRNPDFSTLVSLDGSETYYFGTADDAFIQEIHTSKLLRPERNTFHYLYLESSSKWEDYTPTAEYHFYKKINSKEKYYARFLKSKHEDFTAIPSALMASQNAMEVHAQLSALTVLFFEKHLQNPTDSNPI